MALRRHRQNPAARLRGTVPIAIASFASPIDRSTCVTLSPGRAARRTHATDHAGRHRRSDARSSASAPSPARSRAGAPATSAAADQRRGRARHLPRPVRRHRLAASPRRFGLSTAAVLALNGLSWKSLIFPGPGARAGGPGSRTGARRPAPAAPAAPAPAAPTTKYTVARGDTISGIAGRFGVTTARRPQRERLARSSLIFPGQQVTHPRA